VINSTVVLEKNRDITFGFLRQFYRILSVKLFQSLVLFFLDFYEAYLIRPSSFLYQSRYFFWVI